MASRFWVGGGSANTWAATANTNWATTSGGSNNASVPGTSDIAIFDSNSGTGNSVIGASITVTGLECDGSSLGTGAYAGTLTHNTSVTLTINTGQANSLRFSAGMTYTPASTSSLVTFTHTSGTANIKSYGQKFAALTINGAGGTTQTLDALLVNAVATAGFTVTSGIFDANGGAGGPFPVTAIIFVGTGATTRSVILGGTVTLGGNISSNNQTIWSFGTTTGLTFTKNSANIVVLAPTSAIVTATFASGGLTYNGITLNATTAAMSLNFTGSATFSSFAIGSGWNVGFPGATTTTISSSFAWAGTQSSPIVIYNNAGGGVTAATISVASGACALTWGTLLNITGAGGATFTATNVFNAGSNSGWSITPPADSTLTLNANAVAVLDDDAGAIGRGTVTNGSTTTSIPTSAFTINGSAASGVVSNQFAGRVMLFDGNTTTAGLQGAASEISASSASNTPTFTISVLPATPVIGDTFSVI